MQTIYSPTEHLVANLRFSSNILWTNKKFLFFFLILISFLIGFGRKVSPQITTQVLSRWSFLEPLLALILASFFCIRTFTQGQSLSLQLGKTRRPFRALILFFFLSFLILIPANFLNTITREWIPLAQSSFLKGIFIAFHGVAEMLHTGCLIYVMLSGCLLLYSFKR